MYKFTDGKRYHLLQQMYWQNVILQDMLIKIVNINITLRKTVHWSSVILLVKRGWLTSLLSVLELFCDEPRPLATKVVSLNHH